MIPRLPTLQNNRIQVADYDYLFVRPDAKMDGSKPSECRTRNLLMGGWMEHTGLIIGREINADAAGAGVGAELVARKQLGPTHRLIPLS